MIKSVIEMQIGKKGLTDEFLKDLKRRAENKKVKNIKKVDISKRSSQPPILLQFLKARDRLRK